MAKKKKKTNKQNKTKQTNKQTNKQNKKANRIREREIWTLVVEKYLEVLSGVMVKKKQ